MDAGVARRGNGHLQGGGKAQAEQSGRNCRCRTAREVNWQRVGLGELPGKH